MAQFPFDVDGQVAIVTGGGTGIGAESGVTGGTLGVNGGPVMGSMADEDQVP